MILQRPLPNTNFIILPSWIKQTTQISSQTEAQSSARVRCEAAAREQTPGPKLEEKCVAEEGTWLRYSTRPEHKPGSIASGGRRGDSGWRVKMWVSHSWVKLRLLKTLLLVWNLWDYVLVWMGGNSDKETMTQTPTLASWLGLVSHDVTPLSHDPFLGERHQPWTASVFINMDN